MTTNRTPEHMTEMRDWHLRLRDEHRQNGRNLDANLEQERADMWDRFLNEENELR
jgi:hypothetical protein